MAVDIVTIGDKESCHNNIVILQPKLRHQGSIAPYSTDNHSIVILVNSPEFSYFSLYFQFFHHFLSQLHFYLFLPFAEENKAILTKCMKRGTCSKNSKADLESKKNYL